MTETFARIRWEDIASSIDALASRGFVGTLERRSFIIYKPEFDGGQYRLLCLIGDRGGESLYADDPDALKAEAERWLAGFVSSLGAVFPDEREEFEFPRDGIDLEVAFDLGAYVRYQHPDAGWEDDQETGRKLLTHGRLYRVAWNDIGQSKTRIGLVGIKGVTFNSVLFEPVASEDVTDAEAAEVARRSGIGQAASKKEEG